MAGAKVGVLHLDTGQRVAVSEPRPPGRSYGRMFHTTFSEATAELAKRLTSGATLRVMLVLPQHLNYETFKRLDQSSLAGELGMTQASVSRALTELHEQGVVERKGAGPVTEWRLSSDYGWRGSVDGFHAFQRQKARQAPQVINPPAEQSQKEYYAN